MASSRRGGLAAAGAGFVLARTPWGRAITGIIVARRVWKDPKVQKIRHRIAKQVQKKIDRRRKKR